MKLMINEHKRFSGYLVFGGIFVGTILISLSTLDAFSDPKTKQIQSKYSPESPRQSDFRPYEIPSSLNDSDGLEFAFVNPKWEEVAVRDFSIENDQLPKEAAILSRFGMGTTKMGYRIWGKFKLLNKGVTNLSSSIKLNLQYKLHGSWHDDAFEILLAFERPGPADSWRLKGPDGAKCMLISSK